MDNFILFYVNYLYVYKEIVQVVGKAFSNAVRQEIRLSEEAAKRHAQGKGTAHAAETARYDQLQMFLEFRSQHRGLSKNLAPTKITSNQF